MGMRREGKGAEGKYMGPLSVNFKHLCCPDETWAKAMENRGRISEPGVHDEQYRTVHNKGGARNKQGKSVNIKIKYINKKT